MIFMVVGILFQVFGAPIKRIIDKYLGLLTSLFVVLVIGGFIAFTQFAKTDETDDTPHACDAATQVQIVE